MTEAKPHCVIVLSEGDSPPREKLADFLTVVFAQKKLITASRKTTDNKHTLLEISAAKTDIKDAYDHIYGRLGNLEMTWADEKYVVKRILNAITLTSDDTGLSELDADLATLLCSKKPLVEHCLSVGVIKEIFSLHDDEGRATLDSMIWSSSKLDIGRIHQYFGTRVAWYFSWMQLYCSWLSIPAVLGSTFWALWKVGVNATMLVPVYSIMITLWASLFMIYWRQESARNAHLWSVESKADVDRRVLPSFKGKKRVSPITGETEEHATLSDRLPAFIFSTFVIGVYLIFALYVLLCLLNLCDYMDPGDLFYMPEFNNWVKPSDPIYIKLLPSVVYSVVLIILGKTYRAIALRLNFNENFKYQDDFENALIIKYVLFDFFYCYMALFYVAFYQRNIFMLRKLLWILYSTDVFRRIIVETLIPYLTSGKRTNKNEAKSQIEQMLASYPGDIDEYGEIVIQFGYVSLFAAAFPLGGLLAFLSNSIEIRADLLKLMYATRRPTPEKTRGIGSWEYALNAIVMMSALTNSALFCFTTDILPGLYNNTVIALAVTFCFEHVLLIIKSVMEFFIPSVPDEVKIAHDITIYKNRRTLDTFN